MVKIAWGIPVIRDIDPRVYRNHLGIVIYCYEKAVCSITGIAMPEDFHIVKARNMIVSEVKKGDFDYLFFIAQDIIAPSNVLEVLIADDLPLVSGMYFSKGIPFTPVHYKDKGDSRETGFYKYITEFDKGIGKVEFSGLDCMLIKTEVLQALEFPYFDLIDANATEDSYFCRKVTDKGFSIYLDSRVQLGHLGKRALFDINSFLQHKRNYIVKAEEK